ncbi:MAG: RNA pseudouridine synthase [Planctomycetota bacterium]|nr:RNA pseudouridine synthase [Planctomycetota bacterium]
MGAECLEILYQAGPCFVVAKPAGILTQAPADIPSIERSVRQLIREREGKTGNFYLGVPHRLDRPVSGALVLARHVRACRRLAEQFAERRVGKIYWAVVEGTVQPVEGAWTDHMRKIPGRAKAEIVSPDHPDAREARLTYRVLEATEFGSLLEITLETGRMHQIRLQAKARGFPVIGDTRYGSVHSFGIQYDDPRLRSIALHGRVLSFQHPMTRDSVTVEAPLTEDWAPLQLSSVSRPPASERGLR